MTTSPPPFSNVGIGSNRGKGSNRGSTIGPEHVERLGGNEQLFDMESREEDGDGGVTDGGGDNKGKGSDNRSSINP